MFAVFSVPTQRTTGRPGRSRTSRGGRGRRRDRRSVTALLVAPLNLIFLLVQPAALVAIVYSLIYQVTNGTWSGAGYAYQAESFPTRVRSTAVGFPGAMMAGGLRLGVGLWTS